MSKRFEFKNGQIFINGFPKDIQELVDTANNLEEIASKWQQESKNKNQQIAELQFALKLASKESWGNRASFVSSSYDKRITSADEYAEFFIHEARNNLQREILKMRKENEELRKSQELQTYAENILKIKDLEDQLHTQPKEIVEKIRYFIKENFESLEGRLGCEGVIDREEFADLLDEILKEYGEEYEN